MSTQMLFHLWAMGLVRRLSRSREKRVYLLPNELQKTGKGQQHRYCI